MSQTNVEFVRELYTRVLDGERPPLPGCWHDDAEWHAAQDPDATVIRGLAAIEANMREWEEAFPDVRTEPVEIRAGSRDQVFVWVRVSGQGAYSGASVVQELAHVWTLRDQKVIRVVEHLDRNEALRAVGLRA